MKLIKGKIKKVISLLEDTIEDEDLRRELIKIAVISILKTL